ncbi:hypothetical protein Q8791_10915 [Nocardiopsis sp. CT-R113]|uniref:Uncharacterized protein n=1 Tax=Nocardiopsis codii TaxID=3065942 RepID=A0ABU7K659_9ACTN|nr:hypothetical protein [Nocardiopsis sp. CT-R113]MEE2037731.1 hypothetical protein [Nocardiopsis sp. CT-R113]
MNRKTVTRFVFAAVVAPALALGAPAVAMADTFFGASYSEAGPHGAFEGSVIAVAKDGHGDDKSGSFYAKKFSQAGPHGASQGAVISAAS